MLATNQWRDLFPNAAISNWEVASSYHSALFLNFIKFRQMVNKRFRFENSWNLEPDCRAIIAECWESARNAGIQTKIARCSEQLGRWGEDINKKFKTEIARCRDSIKHLK